MQKTVKRAQIAMISNRKRERRNDKSCDQTTSKKVTCASVVAKKTSNGSGSAQQNVVTPIRTSMPKNKLVSILKGSQEKI